MSGEYGPDYVTVTDEDGNDMELELLDALEYNGGTYMAFLPADVDEDSEDYGVVILKSVEENGEELLSTPDTDEEADEVYELFMRRFTEDGGEDVPAGEDGA